MRVLVVEDEENIRRYVTKALKSEGFAVDAEGDGLLGAHLATTHEYDIMVLDIRLPNLDGFSILRQLRSTNHLAKVLMLSVIGDTTSKVEAFRLGADDYLTKPFAIAELVARIRVLLRRPTQLTGDIIEVGTLVMDINRHEIRCAGRLFSLARKEFALLEYLMRNSGMVMTRSMLLEHVWNQSVDPFSTTVEVHIRNLRRKLEQIKCPAVISTIRGFGYRLDVDGPTALSDEGSIFFR